ncbi:MAG: hypothetical protein FJ206_03230 [Gemmatimonadetes bacterium]|nr:hypothetical protein [Gemmatimonadota bacterium]
MRVPPEQIGAKALEADFFLWKMHAASADLFEFRCYFSAFVSAVTGVFAATEAALGDREGYPAWRATWEARCDANRVARFFRTVRPEWQPIGHTPVHLDRSRWVRFGLWETKHHFTAADDGDVPDLDVLETCTEYLTLIAEMVIESYERFRIRAPAALWSVPALARLGVTVDDIEDSLGFPRGWTAGGGRSDQDRLTLLRRYSPDTPIDRFFLRYLNRTRRDPAEPQPASRP